MRVIILGAGTVGTWIADLLCQHNHSVTIIDTDAEHIRQINSELDVRGIIGSASQSTILFQADVIGADVCLAVTGVDEVNIVAASMTKAMGVRRSIARVYAPVFRDLSTFDYHRHFNIDRLLSLEHLSALELAHGIRHPGSVVVEHIARGELEVQDVVVSRKASEIGVALKDLPLSEGVRIGLIYREGKSWIAGAQDKIEAEDRLTLIGRREDVEELEKKLHSRSERRQKIVIAGGGETGFHLARTLEGGRYSVMLMDDSAERCEFLARNLKLTTVVKADATRRVTLEEERIGSADFFVACTGDDENNIMACVEAKEIGAEQIFAIVNRPDYASVVGRLGIDLAVSPRDVMAKQVLGFMNTGALISCTQLPGGDVEVLELEVLEDSPVLEANLAQLELPEQCLVAAVITEDYVYVPTGEDKFKVGDTVVALVGTSAVEEMLRQFNEA